MPVYTYTTIDDPLATDGTSASGINDMGQIVGAYRDGSGGHGFLLSGGTYTALNDPLGFDTTALGINASGQIVGSYQADAIHRKGFLYDPSRGIFPPYFTLTPPTARDLIDAHGINAAGLIVGGFDDL